MISDDRLEKIEESICASLNEEATPAKVGWPYNILALDSLLTFDVKGGLNAVNARVYAVKVYAPFHSRESLTHLKSLLGQL